MPTHQRSHPERSPPRRTEAKALHLPFVLYQGTTSVVPSEGYGLQPVRPCPPTNAVILSEVRRGGRRRRPCICLSSCFRARLQSCRVKGMGFSPYVHAHPPTQSS